MNANTVKAVDSFIDAVEEMAQGVVLILGVESTTRIIDAGERLREALQKDETILP